MKLKLSGWKSYIAGLGLILTGIAEEIEKNKEAGVIAIALGCIQNEKVWLGLSVMGLRAGIKKSEAKKAS